MSLPLALAIGHVHGRSPEDEEDVLHCREAAGKPPASPPPPSFLASPSFAAARL
jgi:hypothetical protein